MPVADWNQRLMTAVPSIQDEAGNHVMQIASIHPNCPSGGFFLYNGKTDFRDSEIIGSYKADDIIGVIHWGHFVFRSDAALDNAYLVSIANEYLNNQHLRIFKVDSGVISQLLALASYSHTAGVWEKFRVRCWDVGFPMPVVRFSVEVWNGAAWNLKWQIDEATGFLLGVSGRNGFGSRKTNSDGWSFYPRFDDLQLGHEV